VKVDNILIISKRVEVILRRQGANPAEGRQRFRGSSEIFKLQTVKSLIKVL